MKKVELLSPAGNIESLKYAVQNGADAVYLGLNRYSARASSENFDIERLKEAISYAHLRGVLIYVAINTLLDDNDLKNALELAIEADKLNVDAFIVQDLGFAHLLKGNVKTPLHASTQMTVYNEEGIHLLKELGFSRCILSRELSLEEIAHICKQDIMEIEVFCHGAICISYSGQCLLSSAIGGRSGNKGQCAQPCRLRYAILKNNKEVSPMAHRISPNDLLTLPYLERLVQAGVKSLKIEGRLKSPEYTGLVTSRYRKALDIIESNNEEMHYTQKDVDDLSVIFSRGKFSSYHLFNKMPFSDITYNTSGHLGLRVGEILKVKTFKANNKKKNTPDIFELRVKLSSPINKGDGITIGDTEDGGKINSIKTDVTERNILTADSGEIVILNVAGSLKKHIRVGTYIYKTYDEELNKEVKQSVQKENRKIPVTVQGSIKFGSKVIMKMSDGKREVTSFGNEIVEKAETRAITKEDVKRQVAKLGNTVFELNEFTVDLDNNVFVPMSEFSAIRRDLVDKLTAERINKTEGV